MFLSSIFFYPLRLKFFKNKFIFLSFLKKIKKNIYAFFKHKYLCLSFCKKLVFFKSVTSFFYNLFKGFCYSLSLEGKRFKFLINNLFLFFKMDTSHFKHLKFKDVFFLKKFKKNKLLFFYSFDLKFIKSNLLKIQSFKKPTKYKKKGLFLKKMY